jgi:thymidylate synthase (FAD)
MLTTVNRPPENAKFVLDNNQGWVALIDRMGEEIKAVNSARVSYGRYKTEFDEKDAKLLSFLIDEKHFAPLEHITLTFLVHCPLYVRGQWMRTRTGSYNEISRRYTEVDMEIYTPSNYRVQSKDNKQASIDGEFIVNNDEIKNEMEEFNKNAIEFYEKLLKMGVCREQARGVLPQNMMTTFYFTINMRNALHFLSLRMESHAQWEIRVYANAIHDILKEYYPNIIKAFDEGRIK